MLQLIGEMIAGVTRLPIPGPVIGLALLAGFALIRQKMPASIEIAGDGVLKHLSLLFVPAGVGLIAFGERLLSEGTRLIIVLIASTAITMVATALTFRLLTRSTDDKPGRAEPDRSEP